MKKVFKILWGMIRALALTTSVFMCGFLIYSVFNPDKVIATAKFIMHAESTIDPLTISSINLKIDEHLKNLLDETGGDRAIFNRLHNGTKDFSGIHFVYVSRTNEIDGPQVLSTIARVQNIPISVLSTNSGLSDLSKNHCVIRRVIDPNGTALEQLYAELGVKGSIKCPVYNDQNELLGIVGIEWGRPLTDQDVNIQEAKILAVTKEIQTLVR